MCTPTKLLLLCQDYGIDAIIGSKCTQFDFVDNFDPQEQYSDSILHNFELDIQDMYEGIKYLLSSKKISNNHIRYFLVV